MAISNSSGKNSSSRNNPWTILEQKGINFAKLPPRQQEAIIRSLAPKVKILALRLKTKLPKHIELDELISAGTLGLIEALSNFDPNQGIKFETFADSRIRGAMLDELRKMDWFSRGFRQKIKKIEQAIHQIEQNTGYLPNSLELKKITGYSLEEIEEALTALQNQICLSLDAIQENFILPDNSGRFKEPHTNLLVQDLIDKIGKLVKELTKREKMVLSLYYVEELTMKEIAQVLEVTEGRVSQLHSQALKKLKTKFKQRYETGGNHGN
ncbi:FliA/WhiG family RNA polymerase sigma factor [Desulfovulcanus sp.]